MLSNESYFNGVYEQTYRPLLRYAVLKLSNPLDAEDALQNVYMRFFRRIAARGHADIGDPGAFLHRLLRHEIAGHYALRSQMRQHETPLPEAELPADDEELALRTADAQQAEAVLAAARKLSPECYRAFVLYYGFDMSVEQISGALNSSRQAVKSRLFRARRSIRNQLIEKGDLAL